MTVPRPALLARSLLVVVPLALIAGSVSTASAAPPPSTFGSHVSSCAQVSTGFSGAHNPSHHRGPNAMEPMSGMDC